MSRKSQVVALNCTCLLQKWFSNQVASAHDAPMGDFKQLKVWQKSQALMGAIYQITGGFPASESYGLTSQMRRASNSISSNICEGSGRQGDKEFVRFLRMSLGSTVELEGHLLSARRLRLVTEAEWVKTNEATQEIRRMIVSLITYLRRS